MIVYNQAFDLYHAVYRMLQLLTHFNKNEYVEVDRLRIWDFYLLFPNKIHEVRLKREERDIREILKNYISKKENPYEMILENRKMFERIRPYQISALHCLASYGIIDKELLKDNRVSIISKELLQDYTNKFEELTPKERNLISILTSHFYNMSMFGVDGLKDRTKLMVSKYDAK
ncbi:ABC-three component system middle component 5 [Flavobacterium eburneipallidum]|uniref:ABC-three component system middle component 5 n=1 Tax=Flavobacterium eburneipallidum TaxID=3003263 RepID=UPI0022AC05D6|nr:ABC-three component system middle component 5 [Flavobacterium eburneipallidum]